MKIKGHCHYYVEGEDEEKLLSVLKTDMQLITPGKIEKLNVVQKSITNARLMQLRNNTTVVLVFDTDTKSTDILLKNIALLKRCPSVKQIICIPQVQNLEDELIRCCDIRQIKELLGSKSNSEFKHDLLAERNLKGKLLQHKFDINLFWSSQPQNAFRTIKNEGFKVKN